MGVSEADKCVAITGLQGYHGHQSVRCEYEGCERSATVNVQSAYSTFPDRHFCTRHARIMEQGRCDDCYALPGEAHNEGMEH
jgi:hypothetical protein